ncbi:MAG TPA: hypothetical protein VGD24_07260 [Gallionella sp.]
MRYGCLAACALLLGALSGCATYSNSFGAVQRSLAAQNYDDALQELEKQADTKTDRVLYLLNKGTVLRMKRDFSGSNAALEAAKAEMARLYAVSISENTLSYIVNDATVSYAGDDYERVLVHLYMALNYLELGQLAEARVEALQADISLRELAESIPGSKFTEDALTRYLSGMIYEELGEWSDAMIAYRKAYQAYRKYQANYATEIPDMLKLDLVRLATRQGLKKEAEGYRREFGVMSAQEEEGALPEQGGELVFVLSNGLAPIKREHIVAASGPQPAVVMGASGDGRRRAAAPVFVNIALPYYESRPAEVLKARVSISGKRTDTQLMENIDAIARASLDARMPAITARSIARAVSKVAIQQSVDRIGRNNDNDLAVELLGSLFVRVAAIATERADTRSWLTLPANVQMARVAVPPGRYTVTVELLGDGERVIAAREYADVVISEQRKTYLTQHWVPRPVKPEGVRK